jgi:hypothetical protein
LKRFLPLTGVLAIIVVVVAVVVGGETPSVDDPLREIISYYRDNDTEQMTASALLAWGAAIFLVFATYLWTVVRAAQRDRGVGSTLLLAGAIVLTVGLAIFAAIGFTLGDAGDDLGPGAVQALNALNSDFFFPAIIGMFAFHVGAAAVILGSRVLPVWLGWVSVALAVIAITPIGWVTLPVMGLWVIVASILLTMRGEPAAGGERTAA